MKVTVIGAGSTYTPELVKGFLERSATFPMTELWLMDSDAVRLEVVGGFARRMAAAQNSSFEVHLTTHRLQAIVGASYVITQLRVGQMPARRADEYLGRRHGLIGQETTGIGGMAKALRTIPVILEVAADIRTAAPGALLANFTNPAGLITEALHMHAPDVMAVGVCNVPITTKMHILERLERASGQKINPARARLDTLGLNHLSWHRGFTLDGEDVWNQVLETYLQELRSSPEPEWDPQLIEELRMIPNYYLHYYYDTVQKLRDQDNWPPSRAEEVMEVEKDLLEQYADPDLSEPPADLMKRGGAYYSTVATQLLNAHYNDLGETHVVNTSHQGAVPGWVEGVLELPCRVDRGGIHPLPASPLPEACYALLRQVKTYELLTAQAAVTGSRSTALQALLAHPLGPPADQAEAVLEDLLVTHRAYLPAFWG